MHVENIYRQELKDKILQSATLMFYNNGIRKVKMDDIANNLKISKRTLYEIYEKKEDLLFEVLQRVEKINIQRLEEFDKPGTNVIDIIIEALRLKSEEFSKVNPEFLQDMEKYPKLIEYIKAKHNRQGLQAIDFLNRGIKEGYFLSNVNFEIVNILADAGGHYIMSNFLYNKYSFKEIFKTFVMLYVRGICTAKGVELLDKSIDKL
ncbi:TetR/AcrR family transcriptional regulator [Prevotella sp. HUN102]|uniref:TetR/AcrR family transcriptional regulator n=1 Tax=Prevotella sp. HUN102 TaxID=1392486 RepID=UPI00048E0DBF|nr:TetR/AcrR family transcriptional regulator [Prevotella sp. HUN102]